MVYTVNRILTDKEIEDLWDTGETYTVEDDQNAHNEFMAGFADRKDYNMPVRVWWQAFLLALVFGVACMCAALAVNWWVTW